MRSAMSEITDQDFEMEVLNANSLCSPASPRSGAAPATPHVFWLVS